VGFVGDAIKTFVSPLSAIRQLAIIRNLCVAWRATPALALTGPGPTAMGEQQGGGDKDAAAVPGPYIDALARRSAPVVARKWSSEEAAAVLAVVATRTGDGSTNSAVPP
jgi:hypothetical protein